MSLLPVYITLRMSPLLLRLLLCISCCLLLRLNAFAAHGNCMLGIG